MAIARVIAVLVLAAAPMVSQVHFEASSVRRSRPGVGPGDARFMVKGDRMDIEAATVGDILDMLNEWRLHLVLGGPDWMRNDRYDIHATAGAEVPDAERKDAIMALLAERFQLAAHRETRDIPAMVLTAPRRPAGLKPPIAGEFPSIRYVGNDPTFIAVPMSAVTNYLSNMWHMPVVDQTGLIGTFDFSLTPSAVDPQAGAAWGDRVREAVTEFGFRVEMKKVPTEVTVVDRCERPSEN